MTDEHKISFGRAARLDDDERHRRQPPGPLVALVAGLRPGVVLDLGVGTGYFALPLRAAVPGARVVGIDAEVRMFGPLRRKAGGGHVAAVVADAAGVPVRDHAADVVLMVNLYHELDDRPGVLRDVRRVLASGGYLVLSDWARRGTREAGPPPEHRVPEAVAEAELRRAGFAAPESHALYGDFFTLIARA